MNIQLGSMHNGKRDVWATTLVVVEDRKYHVLQYIQEDLSPTTTTMQSYNPYPFSFLCQPGANLITLSINDRDSKNDDYLIAPGATPLTPLYHFHYTDRKKDSSYKVKVEHYGHTQRKVATVRWTPGNAPQLEFPWMTWDCAFLQANEDGQQWLSDVGTLEGHDLEFQYMGVFRDGFVTRCLDVTEAYVSVCGIIMTSWNTGRIEIPVEIVRDWNGLDEMVTVAMTAMQLQREILWVGDSGKRKEPMAVTGVAVSRRSSSSSSSSSSDGGRKMKSVLGKLKKLR
ncbi:hypothetical protein M409DRAFT_59096 [Zasmidium cellare ATCC 36951]|uniref:Uncharacterized protein n=1 Tax=Zasmidium cellare ATCC 36951 TaxID=1080233 RepID=A0A6A6C2P8_ZASCE|nr:uncharacterized protein M409DRAFT_59096 [Zasmidium cellare ATCC 36951]KAF2161384.1 hypothetical protein M409DRAFT_59096 [Zasmidium cellare ATCC 36951]